LLAAVAVAAGRNEGYHLVVAAESTPAQRVHARNTNQHDL
jgi:hypothetical protein